MGRVETGKYADRRLDRYSVSQGIASGVRAHTTYAGGLSPKLDSKLHCSPIKQSREAISIKIVFSHHNYANLVFPLTHPHRVGKH